MDGDAVGGMSTSGGSVPTCASPAQTPVLLPLIWIFPISPQSISISCSTARNASKVSARLIGLSNSMAAFSIIAFPPSAFSIWGSNAIV